MTVLVFWETWYGQDSTTLIGEPVNEIMRIYGVLWLYVSGTIALRDAAKWIYIKRVR